MVDRPPLDGLRVLELGSKVAAPYLTKLFVDAGAAVRKLESPAGDPFRSRIGGERVETTEDGAWFRYLNAGKHSEVVDLASDIGITRLAALVGEVDLVVDDHSPAEARRLGIAPPALREMNPAAVVATLTRFGTEGPWADRPANDFTLQALVGATEARGVPGEEPAAVDGDLGDFVAAGLVAPAVLAMTLAARRTGRGLHIDASQYEAMMHAFQTYRPIFDAFASEYRQGRQIEIPSIEPAADGSVGFCCITGQQWQDFAVMIGCPEFAEDPELSTFDGRMDRRTEVWERIRAFTETRTVDELVELASSFRIPVGPVGSGADIGDLDHFAERGVFVENPHGFVQPRPPYRFGGQPRFEPRVAPEIGRHSPWPDREDRPALGGDAVRPLEGIRVLDLSAFWAGPVAINLLRVLGADVVKVESHVRLDGMRWASGLRRDAQWEWSPVYHGANAGKQVVNLDLSTDDGLALLHRLVARADVVLENYSPRVAEQWGLDWDSVHDIDERIVYVRIPAFGLDGPWRDRVGFAMTMEQVSGLANRTGHPDGPRMVPRGPVDTFAGMHAAFAAILALSDRQRTGVGRLVELPLIEGALQASAEQVVEHSANGVELGRIGNRSRSALLQGLYESAESDRWLAVSVETHEQLDALRSMLGVDGDEHVVESALSEWSRTRAPESAADELWQSGVPASACIHANDSGRSPQHEHRGFIQRYNHAIAGEVPYLSFPFQVNGEHLTLGGPAPTLGQHTRPVLSELGLTDDEIDGLYERGITGDRPANIPLS